MKKKKKNQNNSNNNNKLNDTAKTLNIDQIVNQD